MAVNKIPESQLPLRSVSDSDSVRVVGADGKSYRVPKTDFNGGGGGGTVDPSLSPTSTNAVQNKAIYSALSGLKGDLGDLSDLDTTVKTDLVSAINEVASGGGALTQDTKQALLQCFAHTAWTDDQGQDYYDDLEDALYPFDLLSSITAVYTQSGTVYDTDSLDSLKSDLVVTGNYSDGTYNQTTKYTLSGTLTVGTSTITVTYGGKTATFTVTVTQSQAVLTSITCVYTQSGTVYTTDTLDSLKTDLVVTAHYSDTTSETVPSTDYTLSGTLTAGTSTITVTYGGKTTTFTVTVSDMWTYKWTPSDGTLDQAGFVVSNDQNALTYGQDGVTIVGPGGTGYPACPYIALPIDNTNDHVIIEFTLNWSVGSNHSYSGIQLYFDYNGAKYTALRALTANGTGQSSPYTYLINRYTNGSWKDIATPQLQSDTDYTYTVEYDATNNVFKVDIDGNNILSTTAGTASNTIGNVLGFQLGTYTLKSLKIRAVQ